MELPFINESIFEPHKSSVERRESLYTHTHTHTHASKLRVLKGFSIVLGIS